MIVFVILCYFEFMSSGPLPAFIARRVAETLLHSLARAFPPFFLLGRCLAEDGRENICEVSEFKAERCGRLLVGLVGSQRPVFFTAIILRFDK